MVKVGMKLLLVYEFKDYGNLGILVCYDVRFFEFYWYFLNVGVEVLFILAVFIVYIGKDYW